MAGRLWLTKRRTFLLSNWIFIHIFEECHLLYFDSLAPVIVCTGIWCALTEWAGLGHQTFGLNSKDSGNEAHSFRMSAYPCQTPCQRCMFTVPISVLWSGFDPLCQTGLPGSLALRHAWFQSYHPAVHCGAVLNLKQSQPNLASLRNVRGTVCQALRCPPHPKGVPLLNLTLLPQLPASVFFAPVWTIDTGAESTV